MSQIQKRFKPKLINTKTLNQSFKNALIFKSPTLYVYTKYKRLILTKWLITLEYLIKTVLNPKT